MPGRAGFRMLLWISAAGLAGAGWFGWLVYRDYDWATVGGDQVRSTRGRSMSSTRAYPEKYQEDGQAVDAGENDLLGQTITRWDGIHDLTSLYDKAQDEAINADNQQTQQEISEPYSVQSGQTTYPAGQAQPDAAREDFVVIDPSLPAQPEEQGLDFDTNPEHDAARRSAAQPNAVRRSAAHEDFVVVPTVTPEVGMSPFLATAELDATDEDFVVVPDADPEDEPAELPEVDLSDYVDSWMPIVPKIAALISHELWPQLRSYLESLPQFGDTNLERVVNAVAEDVGVETANADGVGESHGDGFAFYASLFDEMAQEQESELAGV